MTSEAAAPGELKPPGKLAFVIAIVLRGTLLLIVLGSATFLYRNLPAEEGILQAAGAGIMGAVLSKLLPD